MKFEKKGYVWFFLASAAFYIAAIVMFITGENTAIAACWLCLGSSNLCLGAAQMNKYNKRKEEEELSHDGSDQSKTDE